MPRTTVACRLDESPEKVWGLVGDPGKLPRWWPKVERVDRPGPEQLVKWVLSPRGRAVEMVYELDSTEPGRSIGWRQDVSSGPFARSIRSSLELIELSPDGSGSEVRLTIVRRLRGTARLGFPFVARAQRRELRLAAGALEERFGE